MPSAPSSTATLPPGAAAAKRARFLSRDPGMRGVMLIGLFKLSKAIFFTCLGIVALHLVNRNLGEVVMHLTDSLPIDPEGRLVSFLLDKADLIGSHQLRQFSVATLGYAIVCLVEGTGLLLQKHWAEYFTVTLTTLALPWELYELVRRPSWLRAAVLVINLAVLLYLIWILKRNRLRGTTRSTAPE